MPSRQWVKPAKQPDFPNTPRFTRVGIADLGVVALHKSRETPYKGGRNSKIAGKGG
jgi:hypothetical protein